MSAEQFSDSLLGSPDFASPLPTLLAGGVAFSSRRGCDLLQSGDRMTQAEFHELYEQTPQGFKAELIGGRVYVASPLRIAHGRHHLLLGSLLSAYEAATPGVEACDNTTVLLGDDAEPQPDVLLRILPEFGGQSQNNDGYVAGAPEFVVEVALSSYAIDLHDKKHLYARYGVREYLVHCVKERQLRWFDLAAGVEKSADAAGLCRAATFPGLWIDGPALLEHNYGRLMATLQSGLASAEHAAFVGELAARRRPAT